jgi:hypothetical protein
MIWYKYPQLLTQNDHAAFDELHQPGMATSHSGVYRCEGCDKAVTFVSPHPLPPQNHHQHTLGQGAIRWRLAVWG